MRILAIESSCDDLAACVLEGPDKILSSKTASQEKLHARFGGIVPEVASREHLLQISSLVEKTLAELPADQQTLEGVAVTHAPGLVGSLLVGLNFAKGFALARGLPLIGVNHLEGHLMSAFLEERKPTFPFLGLVVSGGHTSLYRVEDIGKRKQIGSTVDDAAGEAYDKVAKMLGLGYPGGPILDRLAALGNPKTYPFTLPRVKRGKYFTSFSGLKTAVFDYIESEKIDALLKDHPVEKCPKALNLIASFQYIVVRILERLLVQASEEFGLSQWVVAGGVACNRALRETLGKTAARKNIELFMPAPKFCTDNAAMIAYVGEKYLSRGIHSDFNLNAIASETQHDLSASHRA